MYLNVLLGDSDDESLAASDSDDEDWALDENAYSSSDNENILPGDSVTITRSGRRSVRGTHEVEESDDSENSGAETESEITAEATSAVPESIYEGMFFINVFRIFLFILL